MKDKKKIIITLIIIILILVVALIYYYNSSGSYIVLDNKVINYNKGQFIDKDFTSVKKLYFNIFYDNNYIGKYYAESLTEDNIYFTNNESESSYNFRSPYIAITGDYTFLTFEYNDASESDFNLFKENYDTIVSFEEVDEFKKSSIDIDNDGKKEEIYYIIYNDIENSNSFSVTYIVDDYKFVLINENMYQNSEFGTSKVQYVLKRNNTIYLIVNTYYMDDSEYSIYTYSNKIKKMY
jgi:hypothetical protein